VTTSAQAAQPRVDSGDPHDDVAGFGPDDRAFVRLDSKWQERGTARCVDVIVNHQPRPDEI